METKDIYKFINFIKKEKNLEIYERVLKRYEL